jgi:hypothetical protein
MAKSEKSAEKKPAAKKAAPKAKAAPAPKAKAKAEKADKPEKAAQAPAKGRAPKKPKNAPQESLDLRDESGPAVSDVRQLEGFAPAPGADAAVPAEEALGDDDEDALHERIAAEAAELAAVGETGPGELEAEDAGDEPAAPLSPEEQELAALYGDEMSSAPAAAAHGEYKDRQTADEDRAMLPEINGRVERQKRWEARRDERRARRDQDRARRQENRGGGQGRPAGEAREAREPRPGGERHEARPERAERFDRDRGGDRPREDRAPNGERPALPAPIAAVATGPEGQLLDDTGVIRVGNSLGDAAWAVFASIKGAQPMPVRQLAGMMRKRGLIDSDPEVVWPHLKAALLGDERSYKSLGLRPRIVYRGRDLFAPGPVAVSPTAAAEAELARAMSVMAVATHRTLKDKIATASQAGFERLVHAYLVSAGFRDISWIKRVEGISYATALPPEGATSVLISARSGNQAVDRRGVGELRVGVEAKQLLAGYLFAARELSPDAERELERNGRSITVVAGDAFVSALLASGVGVVTAAAPLRYVDDQLLSELLAG